jgi:hypothetical protein
MKLVTEYWEDTDKGQYTAAVEDSEMVPFLKKLQQLAGKPWLKIYWTEHKNYRDDCTMVYIYGRFTNLKHEVTLANSCGAGGRRIWLEHEYQRSWDDAIRPIFLLSDAQIAAFDDLFDAWLAAGKDMRNSDDSVVDDIMELI